MEFCYFISFNAAATSLLNKYICYFKKLLLTVVQYLLFTEILHIENKVGSNACDVCKFVMQYLDATLQENTTQVGSLINLFVF